MLILNNLYFPYILLKSFLFLSNFFFSWFGALRDFFALLFNITSYGSVQSFFKDHNLESVEIIKISSGFFSSQFFSIRSFAPLFIKIEFGNFFS